MNDLWSRLENTAKYYVYRLVDLLKITQSFLDDVNRLRLKVYDWLSYLHGEERWEIVEEITGFESVKVKHMVPIVDIYSDGLNIGIIDEWMEVIFETTEFTLFMSSKVPSSTFTRICGFSTTLYDISKEDEVGYAYGEVPEVYLYILSLHTDEEFRKAINDVYKRLGILWIFEGVNERFRPAYGLTESVKNSDLGRDFLIDLTSPNDVLRYDDLVRKYMRDVYKLHEFEKHGIENMRWIDVSYDGKYYCISYSITKRWGVSSYIRVEEKYPFRPIYLIKTIDLVVSSLMYYMYVFSKIYRNITGVST